MRKILARLTRTFRISAVDPSNFEEKWGFRTTPVQLYSFLIFTILLLSALTGYAFYAFGLWNSFGFEEVDRKELADQEQELQKLSEQVRRQEVYIANLKNVLSGNIHPDTLMLKMPEVSKIDLSKINPEPTENERKVSENVMSDIRTQLPSHLEKIPRFLSPLRGKVSQKFDAQKHPAIDIVAAKGTGFKACLAGTVVYAGFTQKDGNMLIIMHPNEYMTVYKHAEALFKTSGERVQTGDLIGITGNTGENTTGPHLHFELWYQQKAVDPAEFMNF